MLPQSESPHIATQHPSQPDHVSSKSLRRIIKLILTIVIPFCLVTLWNYIIAERNIRFGWLAPPVLWIASAILATTLMGKKLTTLGLNLSNPLYSLKLLLLACLISFPAAWAGLQILQYLNFNIPLSIRIEQGLWLNWILYQLFYVAVAEEIFFRGYLINNLLELTTSSTRHCKWAHVSAILISACVFALAHVIIQSDLTTAFLTFLPGLILAWLFLHTRSLLAPILFHGLANTFYAFICS